VKGWVAWAFTTALGLVTLQALATREAPGRIGDLLTDANRIIQRVLDPDVAAIPDLAAGRAGGQPAAPATPGGQPAAPATPGGSGDSGLTPLDQGGTGSAGSGAGGGGGGSW